jgi:beta,beta-carotene 9',10'-dioxygenase
MHDRGTWSLTEEVGPAQLPVTGKLPDWLGGALLRTGPALFEIGSSRYRHWFDGLAMLYRFAFREGGVIYANRFLKSRGYLAAMAKGRVARPEFATLPDIGLIGSVAALIRGPVPSNNANVSVTARGDGVFALTETPVPMAFDPETLETLGPAPFHDSLRGQITTAHPHTDARRGVQVNVLTRVGRRSEVQVVEHPLGGGARRLVAALPVDRPAYIHSFGMTDRHVIVVEPPLRVTPLALRLGLKPFIANYRWHRGQGTRFRLIDRSDGRVVTLEGEPCFPFHQANAFDDGDAVVIDLCVYPDAGIIDELMLDRLRASASPHLASSRLVRCRLPKAGGDASMETIVPVSVDLPRLNDGAVAGRRYSSLWAASVAGAGSGFFDRILRIDVEHKGHAAQWQQQGAYVGEPVFVPRPGGEREADGLVLSLILDAPGGRSVLLALDGETLEERARADLPHVVPFHFHGRHVTAAPLADTSG